MPRRRDATTSAQRPTRRLVRLAAVGGVAAAVGGVHVRAVEARIAGWGSTAAERGADWPGDELVAEPGFTWTNAVGIDRPAAEVWPWVRQLGQGRGGLYSYDWLENLLGCDVHSADRVLSTFQEPLRVGDRVVRMCRYAPHTPIARYDEGHALVLGGVHDSAADLAAGRASSTWAFIVEPVDAHRSRLIVRSRAGSAMARVQGPVQFLMQRRMMRGIAERAEGRWGPSPRDVLDPLLWSLAAALALAGAAGALTELEGWWRPLAIAGAAVVAGLEIAFWEPPPAVGAAVLLALAAALLRRAPGATGGAVGATRAA